MTRAYALALAALDLVTEIRCYVHAGDLDRALHLVRVLMSNADYAMGEIEDGAAPLIAHRYDALKAAFDFGEMCLLNGFDFILA